MLVSYAQNAEDIVLHRVFKSLPTGFYIDIGACFPEEGSVTKIFYDRGWHGINVEPHPQLFRLLVEQRPRDINLNVAISKSEDGLTLYEYPSIGETSAIPRENAASFEVSTLTLKKLCENFAKNVAIDFLKIDVEGLELEVIMSGDWLSFRPKVVICEVTRSWSNDKREEVSTIDNFLESKDYLFAYFDGINHYYVEKNHSSLINLIAIQPNVIDSYITRIDFINRQELESTFLDRDQWQKNFEVLETNFSDLKIQHECTKIISQQDQERLALSNKNLEAISQKQQLKIYKSKVQNSIIKARVNALEEELKASKKKAEELDLIAATKKSKIDELEKVAAFNKSEIEELEKTAAARKTKIVEMELAAVLNKNTIEELNARANFLTSTQQEYEKKQFELAIDIKVKENLLEQYCNEIQKLITKEHAHHENLVALELSKIVQEQEITKLKEVINNLNIANQNLLDTKSRLLSEFTISQNEVSRLHTVINQNSQWGKRAEELIEELSSKLQLAQLPWYKKISLVPFLYKLIRKTIKIGILFSLKMLQISARILRKISPKAAKFLGELKWVNKFYTVLDSRFKKGSFQVKKASEQATSFNLQLDLLGTSYSHDDSIRNCMLQEVQKWSLGKRVDV